MSLDNRLHTPKNRTGERGIALITGLIFLAVLTMIGVTAAKMAGLEERMSGNLRDRSFAMQAAEMALRDAEQDILKIRSLSDIGPFLADCGTSVAPSNQDGLCYNGPGGYETAPPAGFVYPVWTTPNIMTAVPSVAYGHFTGAAAITLVSAQPRYLIEGFGLMPGGSSQKIYYYRITVRAQGANANTVVWLQELLTP